MRFAKLLQFNDKTIAETENFVYDFIGYYAVSYTILMFRVLFEMAI